MPSLDPAVIDQSSPTPVERRLWAAVLRQAISDLRYHRSTLQHFTRLWFESDNRRGEHDALMRCVDRTTVATWKRAIEVMEVVPARDLSHTQPTHAREIARSAPKEEWPEWIEKARSRWKRAIEVMDEVAISQPSLSDLGIDRRRVAEWREMRDAGEGVVEGALGEALSEGRPPVPPPI